MSLHDVNTLPMEDAQNIWNMYSAGLIGPFKEYKLAYMNTQYLHTINEHTKMTISSKRKYKPKDLEPFDKVFPDIYKWWTLNHKPMISKVSVVESARSAIAASEGAPAWLIEAVKEQEDAGSNKSKGSRS